MSAEKYGMVLRQVLQAAELERLFDGLLPPRPSHWLGRPSSDACFVPRAVEPVEMTITPSRSDQVPLFVQQFFMQVRHRGSRQTKRGGGGRDQHRNAPTRVADEPVTETCCNSGFPIPGEQRTRNAIAARSRAQTGYARRARCWATGEQFGRDKRDLSSQCELGAGRIGSSDIHSIIAPIPTVTSSLLAREKKRRTMPAPPRRLSRIPLRFWKPIASVRRTRRRRRGRGDIDPTVG